MRLFQYYFTCLIHIQTVLLHKNSFRDNITAAVDVQLSLVQVLFVYYDITSFFLDQFQLKITTVLMLVAQLYWCQLHFQS